MRHAVRRMGIVCASLLACNGSPEPPAPPVGPPPAPVIETDAAGARVARVDTTALAAWCRANALPPPPALDVAEPAVMEGFLEALEAAATTRTAEAFGRMGQICESLDSHVSAEAYFTRAANEDPADFRWPYYLGCIHQVVGRTDDAARAFEHVLELNDAYPVTYARLAQIRLDQGRLEDAEASFEAYRTRAPADWLGEVGLGRIALERGDAERALSWLRPALRKGPDDFQVHYNLGRTYAALGDRERAKIHFDRANAAPQGLWFHLRDPLDRELHAAVNSVASLASTFEAKMGSANAAELIPLGEDILARRPTDVTMMGNLAGLYRAEKRFAEAYATLDSALTLAPGSARLLNVRAEVSLADGKPEAALREAEWAISADSTASRPHATKGRALATLGRYEEAAASLERSLELDADRTSAVYVSNRYALAEVERLRGRLDAARAGYEAVLAIAPGYGPARQRLQALGRPAK